MITARTLAGFVVTALLSGTAGWLIHGSDGAHETAAVRSDASIATRPSPSTARADPGPVIVVASDGNVTLRVEQQPLEWVLEQIARQGGWTDAGRFALAKTSRSDPTGTAVACAETPPLTPAQTQKLLQSIQHGSEPDRFQGLLQARSDGVAVSDEVLKVLYETDASDRVRLLAFESYLEPRAGDGATLRRALESALYVPNGAVQQEARKRLDELIESERVDAGSEQ